jgi:hypothetical protein
MQRRDLATLFTGTVLAWSWSLATRAQQPNAGSAKAVTDKKGDRNNGRELAGGWRLQ